MKNLLKFGFLGLALTFMVAACGEPVQEDATEVELNTEEVIINEEDSLIIDTVVTDGDVLNDEIIEENPEVN